jgi:hypothetical protein
MVPMAVTVERPGQNPCCSVENNRGTKEFRRSTKRRISILYQTEVTEIGLSYAGDTVDCSALGIAVNKVINKG